MQAEQGSEFMSNWGGSEGYRMMAQLAPDERMVYAAVLDDYKTPEEISSVVDMPVSRVEGVLGRLGKKRLVSMTEVVKEPETIEPLGF